VILVVTVNLTARAEIPHQGIAGENGSLSLGIRKKLDPI
jgi:hypothetical protein